MSIFEIGILITFVTCLILHVKNVEPSRRLSRRLEKAVRDNGGDPIVGKFGWQFKMFTDANIILNESDTPEIRALKVEFIDKWKASFRSHRLIIWMFFVGIVLSAIAQAIGTLIVK